jgi:hypothetical protein
LVRAIETNANSASFKTVKAGEACPNKQPFAIADQGNLTRHGCTYVFSATVQILEHWKPSLST